MVNGLRKIVWAPDFRLERQHMYKYKNKYKCECKDKYKYKYKYIYTHTDTRKPVLTENGNIRLSAANGKRERQTSLCLLQRKWKTEVCFPWLANDK
jgi:hypothetical protein